MDDIDYNFESRYDENFSLLTRKLIRYISEDSRTSILELSKRLGVSRRTVRERLIRAEKELGISYTVEFNESAMGLANPHLILAKFTKKPDWNEVTRLLASSYIPQFAVGVKGKFDLLIYANAMTSGEYVHWDKGMQIMLSKYGVLWHPSDVAHKQLGFFPIRDELIDTLKLDKQHKEMLKILNTNSRATFSEISKRTGMHFNTVAYNFNKLVDSGIIKRFTISIKPPKDLIRIVFFSKYVLAEKFEDDAARIRKVYTTSGTEYPIFNRYQVCAQLVGSYDFFNMSIFDNYDTAYQQSIVQYKDVMKKHNVKVDYGQADLLLMGKWPLRSIDTKKEYNIIKWTVPSDVQHGA
jgi:DNA-binding Lrp family transcriptional regulator